jgi:hypothetical protein
MNTIRETSIVLFRAEERSSLKQIPSLIQPQIGKRGLRLKTMDES